MSVYITGCEKDADRVFHDSALENRYDSTASTSNSLLDNINFDQDGNILIGNDTNQIVIQHAGIEYQREASEYLFQNASSSYINNIREQYGIPQWKLALINLSNENEDNFIVSLPLFKNNELTSMIFYYNFNDFEYAIFISKNDIQNTLTRLRESSAFYNEWFLPVSKFQLIELLTKNINYKSYSDWLSTANLITQSDNSIMERMMCPFLGTYYSVTGSESNPYQYFHSENVIIWVSCSGGGHGGFGFYNNWGNNNANPPTGGGGGSNNNNNNNNENNSGGNNDDAENKTLKKLNQVDCAPKIIGFMGLNKIDDMISNDALTDPCDPNLSTEQIIKNALEDKCENEGADNLGTVDDFLEDLGKKISHNLENCWVLMDEDINPCEKELVIKHPYAATSVLLNSKFAEEWTIKKFGKNGWLDCSDAFRHALWNAMNARDIGKDLALKFSNAHECNQNDNDSKMDIFNNSVGHRIGVSFPINNEVLADRICDQLEEGHLKILDYDPNLKGDSPIINSFKCKCN